MMRNLQRSGGFTLIEVMVALAVVATAFTALLSLHVSNLETVARENAFSRSLLLAETLAAEAQLEGYPDLGTTRGDFSSKMPGNAEGFTWKREVREWMLPGTREITIEVVPPRGEESASELTLFVSRNLR